MRLLIIEDEQHLRDAMLEYFNVEKYQCEVAATYMEAEDKVLVGNYDCVVLDLMLPDGDGMNLVRVLRDRGSDTGVIIVTARGALEDKLKGLELGSDDYLCKPFHLSELNARLKALVRRRHFDAQNTIEVNEIKVDLGGKTVKVANKPVTLTPKEYRLLVYFMVNRDRVVTKESVAQHLSTDDFSDGGYDFIYAHVKNLRRKLIDTGCGDYLKTIYGLGYKFTTE